MSSHTHRSCFFLHHSITSYLQHHLPHVELLLELPVSGQRFVVKQAQHVILLQRFLVVPLVDVQHSVLAIEAREFQAFFCRTSGEKRQAGEKEKPERQHGPKNRESKQEEKKRKWNKIANPRGTVRLREVRS